MVGLVEPIPDVQAGDMLKVDARDTPLNQGTTEMDQDVVNQFDWPHERGCLPTRRRTVIPITLLTIAFAMMAFR
jgi:hypothetical protein